MSVVTLRHGHLELALHELRGGGGPRLLLLHELGGCTPASIPVELEPWSGAVYGLDFAGHGASSIPHGGGYTPEALLGNADAALQHLGEASLVGAGLGAYVALLLAGSRPAEVRGAVLCDGRGLSGGGPEPGLPTLSTPPQTAAPPDPWALDELTRDVRPPGYARLFARQAHHLGQVEPRLSVVARRHPPWLSAVLDSPATVESDLATALKRLSAWVPEPCIGA